MPRNLLDPKRIPPNREPPKCPPPNRMPPKCPPPKCPPPRDTATSDQRQSAAIAAPVASIAVILFPTVVLPLPSACTPTRYGRARRNSCAAIPARQSLRSMSCVHRLHRCRAGVPLRKLLPRRQHRYRDLPYIPREAHWTPESSLFPFPIAPAALRREWFMGRSKVPR